MIMITGASSKNIANQIINLICPEYFYSGPIRVGRQSLLTNIVSQWVTVETKDRQSVQRWKLSENHCSQTWWMQVWDSYLKVGRNSTPEDSKMLYCVIRLVKLDILVNGAIFPYKATWDIRNRIILAISHPYYMKQYTMYIKIIWIPNRPQCNQWLYICSIFCYVVYLLN